MIKKIAITGGIGSGKSYVAEYIKKLGYPVFSCDEIYKELLSTSSYVENIRLIFPEVVSENKIDKTKLSKIVFENKAQLEKLNRISHPLIMRKLYDDMNVTQGKIVFAEVPLLFECGYEKDFCETIYVKRNLSSRIQGIIQRDKIGEGEALARIKNQIDFASVQQKIEEQKLIVYFIDNNGTLLDLENQIEKILDKLNA